jgi:hypothetical protein
MRQCPTPPRAPRAVTRVNQGLAGFERDEPRGLAGYWALNTASVLPTRMMSPGSRVFFGTLWPLT